MTNRQGKVVRIGYKVGTACIKSQGKRKVVKNFGDLSGKLRVLPENDTGHPGR